MTAFSEHARRYVKLGISVIPIAPGTKRPGKWSQSNGWEGMGDWSRFSRRLPTEIELDYWSTFPDAGIGVVLGPASGLIAIDKDYDLPGGNDALEAIIPYTPVSKKGEKGYTKFYRSSGEPSRSFDVRKQRVLDILAEGRQTVVPPTLHPAGMTYVWITDLTLDTLESIEQLPFLPPDFMEQVENVLLPYQTPEDLHYQKAPAVIIDRDGPIAAAKPTTATAYYRDLNEAALTRLSEWVPALIPSVREDKDGYRCIAHWRNCEAYNVGIHPGGIRDWGGNYGMTAISLVMYARGVPFAKAAELLRNSITMSEQHIAMTVGQGQAPGTAPKPASALPTIPWTMPVVEEKPSTVMLPPVTSNEPEAARPSFLENPPGILGDITRWMTETAPKRQPELALAGAIALCSVVMGRTYVTQVGNLTSLYVIMVAKSTEGKEHPQKCVHKILTAAGLENMIAGSGYTSSGAVYSTLMRSPAHIVTIDEMGKLLKLSRSTGQANHEAALDKLVEAFGKLNGVMVVPNYSEMTLKKSERNNIVRTIHFPAITLLGATTPDTFYGNLSSDMVKDGFLGRCMVIESKRPRQRTQFVQPLPPPEHIVEWCKAVHVSGAVQGDLAAVSLADVEPRLIEITLDEDVFDELQVIEDDLMSKKDWAEGLGGLDVLIGRTVEKALRLSLIAAKARDMHTTNITLDDFKWAYEYVSFYDLNLVTAVSSNQAENQYAADMNKMLDYIRNAKRYAGDKKFSAACNAGGLPNGKLQKLMRGTRARDLAEMIQSALDSGDIAKSPGAPWSLACDVYFAK
ncbi:MAG: bifunctional DNA primase/polymerase [Porticoccaceae bacterium]